MPSEVADLNSARRHREERRDIALLELFSAVLSKPLERRELTAEQAADRAVRLQDRRARRRPEEGC